MEPARSWKISCLWVEIRMRSDARLADGLRPDERRDGQEVCFSSGFPVVSLFFIEMRRGKLYNKKYCGQETVITVRLLCSGRHPETLTGSALSRQISGCGKE